MAITKNNTRMLDGSIDLTSKVTGILPVANGGTGTSSATSSGVFSSSFESSEQTIGNVTVNHGLGSVPKLHQVVIRCKDASNLSGYAVGDEVDVNLMRQSTTQSYDSNGYYSNSTVLGFIFRSADNIPHKDGSNYRQINTAQWKLVFRAFA